MSDGGPKITLRALTLSISGTQRARLKRVRHQARSAAQMCAARVVWKCWSTTKYRTGGLTSILDRRGVEGTDELVVDQETEACRARITEGNQR